MEWEVLLFITKVLVLDLYLTEKVLDVLDVFQVLWVLELVLVLANMKKYLYLTQVLQKVLDPNPEYYVLIGYLVWSRRTTNHISMLCANYMCFHGMQVSQSGPARTHRRRRPPSCMIVTAMIVTVSPQCRSLLSNASHNLPTVLTWTHWLLKDVEVILTMSFSNSFYGLISWVLLTKLLSGKCHRTCLTNQHWSRQWLGAATSHHLS